MIWLINYSLGAKQQSLTCSLRMSKLLQCTKILTLYFDIETVFFV